MMDMAMVSNCCSLAMAAHQSSEPFVVSATASATVFAFPSSWSAADWIGADGDAPFGTAEVDRRLFPSLRKIWEDQNAMANASFLANFERLLHYPPFKAQVQKALQQSQPIHFTGHSLGGATAILATLWCLEHTGLAARNQPSPFCVTFGAPLVGDSAFFISIFRQNWSTHFLHFVAESDIVPSLLLTPLSFFKDELQAVLYYLCPKSLYFSLESVGKSQLVLLFYATVSRNALSFSNYISCYMMGCASSFFGSLAAFLKPSPYVPFGTYMFCTEGGRMVSVKNPVAALQLLIHHLKWDPEEEPSEIAYKGLNEHLRYESIVGSNLEGQNVGECCLPDYSIDEFGDEVRTSGTVFTDHELSREIKLCLHTIGQWEKQRSLNQARVLSSREKIEEALMFLQDYRAACERRGLNYYDSFKLQKNTDDFDANVKRLELAGIWDEIVEMLRRYELPPSFEAKVEWANLGAAYRNLVEPLDIANYYGHMINEDTGSYMAKGRPKRYQYTERWYVHTSKVAPGSCAESCFWAMVEELCTETNSKTFEEVRQKVVEFEAMVLGWFRSGKLGRDVLLGDSTFVSWWKSLPEQHRLESVINGFVTGAKGSQ